MGYLPSLRKKAAHLVSDLTTVIFNPISNHSSEERDEPGVTSSENTDSDKDSEQPDGPDTSSFTAFLVSLLSSTDSSGHVTEESMGPKEEKGEAAVSGSEMQEYNGKKSLLSRGKHSVGKVIQRVVRIGGYRQNSEPKTDVDTANGSELVQQAFVNFPDDRRSKFKLPCISEPSPIMSEDLRRFLYFSLPPVAQGRNWVLLYSTWRHGISLSTMYRRSLLCPGYCLLVVGDLKGAVFGGLLEAPLLPSNKKYQGTNSSFVFTNLYNDPIIFRPTGSSCVTMEQGTAAFLLRGVNHYFALCSPDYLAMGGGGHFALYLDVDLLNGSSYKSETFGNSCLAHSEDFRVKEVELWGFVYASKYEEMIDLCRTEKPGICNW